ncbi:MAG: hypothetical protein QM803_12350 [Rhodocyclaceae bacterium]
MSITLTARQLHELLAFINPDGRDDEAQMDTLVTIEYMPERRGVDDDLLDAGYYAFATDNPDDGLYGPI